MWLNSSPCTEGSERIANQARPSTAPPVIANATLRLYSLEARECLHHDAGRFGARLREPTIHSGRVCRYIARSVRDSSRSRGDRTALRAGSTAVGPVRALAGLAAARGFRRIHGDPTARDQR